MIFARTEAWLDQYFGPGHGIGIGITETDASGSEMTRALWYASMLGTFADHGVEVFCPWGWHDSWWEVLHLFSRYAQGIRVEAASSDGNMVSAYASASEAGDAMTIIFVNRYKDRAQPTQVTLAGFAAREGQHRALSLRDLPERQATFRSDKQNALREGTVTVANNGFALDLPPYSITAVLLEGQKAAATGGQ